MESVGHLIKTFRKRKVGPSGKPMSQLELCMKIGWENASTLSRIEKDEVKPTRETLIKMGESLNLSIQELNLLMQRSSYTLLEPKITHEYKKELAKILEKEWEKVEYPLVLLRDIPTEVIYWNDCTQYFFLGKGKMSSWIIELTKNKTHIDLMFDRKYQMRQNIINWDDFSYAIVKNMFVLGKLHEGDEKYKNTLHKWMKYTEFQNKWDEISKETNPEMTFRIPFIYNHPKVGIINITITTFSLFQDMRFYVQQFTPCSPEDSLKMKHIIYD